MSRNSYRRFAASALLAGSLGSLGLLASTVEAASATRAPVATRWSVLGSVEAAWSRLVHLFASDGTGRHHDHSGGGPNTDEGPGMCPHGH
jgi:hypothetical protein